MSRAMLMNFRQLVDTNRKWKNISLMYGKQIMYSISPIRITRRTFINFLVPDVGKGNKKVYKDKKLIGYSPVQMFDVIQDTENYKNFLPFCRQSSIKLKEKNHTEAYLEIGFPPIIESYVSHITYHRPHMIKAECRNGKLFKHLITQWNCDPGMKNNPNTCIITFYLSYEFKSQLHSTVANMFFNELVKQMEQAFFVEAARRYGKPCIRAVKL